MVVERRDFLEDDVSDVSYYETVMDTYNTCLQIFGNGNTE